MCSTCGCAEGARAVIVNPEGAKATSAHDAPHAPDHHHDATRAYEHSHPHPHLEEQHRTIRLEQDILAKNNRLAECNRGWFAGRNIFAVNLMSAPGAGKTTLLERTIRDLGSELTISVIEGDQETPRDAERIRAAGARAVQINTGTGCHLDADMLSRALRALEPAPRSVVMIENVGNLVCPALFDLGESARVVIMSVTEGEDKPLKYPHMFRAADAMVLSKADLLPYLEFDHARCVEYARRVNPRLELFTLSAVRGTGLDAWYEWLRRRGAS